MAITNVKPVNNQYVNYTGATSTALAANATLNFETVQQQFGKYIQLNNNGTQINITLPGTYIIHFNATALNTGTAASNVEVGLRADGVPVVGAIATETAAASGVVNLVFNGSVTVGANCCCNNNVSKVLTVVNGAVPATYTIRNIIIERVNRKV